MSQPPNTEMIKGFIEEVQSYIPSLIGGLESLEETPDLSEALEETHRLVHTIKGASSMVGLAGLSQIAFQMEEYLDEVIAGKQQFKEESFSAMHQTIHRFQEYCRNYLNGGVAARSMLKETAVAFLPMRGLSISEDEDMFKQLLASVPEQEGLAGEANDVPQINDTPDNQDRVRFDGESGDGAGIDRIETAAVNDDCPVQDEGRMAVANPEINSVNEIAPELLESFYEEAEEHLDELGRSVHVLESQVSETIPISPALREEIRRIRRSVHTLKGAAAVIGFQDFATYAHSLEDLLDWLYEDVREISVEIVRVLEDSSDMLERIVTEPHMAMSAKAQSLIDQFKAIMNPGAANLSAGDEPEAGTTDSETMTMLDEILEINASDAEKESPVSPEPTPSLDTASPPGTRPAKSLRVDTAKIDELVNLTGETIIALSAFDQKMELFTEAVNDLEIARKRLRKIARDLEISYEVKALEQLRTKPEFSVAQVGNALQVGGFKEFDALELDRYSELNLIIRTMNECAIDVGAIHTQMSNLHSDFDGHLTRQQVILRELQDKMMRVRMTPMSIITNRLRQTVREVSSNLGKKVKLEISGEDIELDKIIWEKITDPLMHLLRNAIDHGVEPSTIRQALGKSSVANIKLMASREGNQVVIRISDDGAGLNFKAIRSRVRHMQLAENISEMTNDDVTRFIFYPGFSTRDEISEVSGRGVGMDVVKENIRDLKGSIQAASQDGHGTHFTIRIPLTLATVRALLFTTGGQTFAIGLNEISEIIRLDPNTVMGPHQDSLRLKNEVLPLYHMAELLNTDQWVNDASSLDKNPVTLVVEIGDRRAVLVVDTLVGQREIVIKNLGSHLRHVKGISGATVLGDGRVVPILNIEELLWHQSADQTKPSSSGHTAEKPLEIMVVDDSVSIRQVVSRLMQDQGWQVQTAKDGLDALEKLRASRPNLIVLDIEMPRMNGYEFLGNFRAQSGYEDIPVVMLTSRTAEKHRAKAFSLGAKGFVVKPFNDDEFVRLIQQLTNRPSK